MNSFFQQPDREANIIESFSKHVKTYEKHAQLQKAMAERLASLLPETLPDKILELGCGTGVFTRHLLARPVRSLVLNDIAPAMIDYLKTQNEVPSDTQVILGNAEHLDFPRVDMIVANAVFQWFQNPKKTLKRLTATLTPGGFLAFSTFGPQTLKEFRETGIESPIILQSQAQWKKLIRETGLRLEESYAEIRKVFFPDALTLTKNLQQIGAAPLRMLKAGELRKLIRHYDTAFASPQGVYSTWELYYFSALRPKR